MSGETTRERSVFCSGVLRTLRFFGVSFPRAFCTLVVVFCPVRPLLPFWAGHAFFALLQRWRLANL